MRLAGSISNQHDAATFVDYLLTLGISAKVERNGDAWELWIFDEDQLPQGREELAKFQADPQAEAYRDAAKQAATLRREKLDKELAARRLQMNVPRPTMLSSSGRRPVTMCLLTISLLVFLFGEGKSNEFADKFYITHVEKIGERVRWDAALPEIRSGQVWRVVTPIFIHFDVLHLAFNMWWLVVLGTQVEMLRGPWRMLGLTLLFAIFGNLAQYYFSHPLFGGMSGVVYGLFGYVWMKSVYEPWSGFFMQPVNVFIMVAWFLLGLTGEIGSIANYAHGVGLALGIAAGYAPTLLRNARKGGKS